MSETLTRPATVQFKQVERLAVLTAMEAACVRRLYVNIDWNHGYRSARISCDAERLPSAIVLTSKKVAEVAYQAFDATHPWAKESCGFVEITSVTNEIVMHASVLERI